MAEKLLISELEYDDTITVYDFGKSEWTKGITVIGYVVDFTARDFDTPVAVIKSGNAVYEITDDNSFTKRIKTYADTRAK
ncbi:hypothetical protein [Staphylococcus simiae]|uniref:Uncharacterized protein n=1 Tax=Staphylococcus simiae CCM 7213 = CCUG 51256 TaxID=911238 RepID=G5JH64_9STAP|nr:hypothetical protein [Staphylococcus simiae]EHJ08412.1 hypothetical protein SS7213T_03965 [Staphylococcus simiae CCM 7213 = CCUG 51256]PNZ12628.1 hypothetical protein CD113_06330 [Staphylococcus simiae]SNV67122.1 Uncharacterised protein [Staphylococcus simiae]